MTLRYSAWNLGAAVLAAAMLVIMPAAVAQQDDLPDPSQKQKKLPEAPSKLPKVPADRSRGLEFLFGALKAAPDDASARAVEARIWALWLQTPSDTAALLMSRAKAAMMRARWMSRSSFWMPPSSCAPTMSR